MEYLSAKEAADYLGVKTSTLYAYVSRGLLDSVPAPEDTRRNRYRKSDLDRLRRRSSARAGHGAAAADALDWGAPSLDTAISEISYAGPSYRGRLARHLVDEESRFEVVAEFLWSGQMPEKLPRWLDASAEAVDLDGVVDASAGPVDILRVAVTLAGFRDPSRFASEQPAQRQVARQLITRAVATLADQRGGDVAACETIAQLIARAFGVSASAQVCRALDAALVIVADHELNASTFSARVAASTGADLYACVGAALATLSGPRHGGACDRCDALLAEISAAGSAQAVLMSRVRRGESPPGFGHRLYPHGDPRFGVLMGVLRAFACEDFLEQIDDLQRVAEQMELGAPTVDLGLALLAAAMGLPHGAAAAIFATGRMAGLIAHAFEQRDQGFMLRPRARYVGE